MILFSFGVVFFLTYNNLSLFSNLKYTFTYEKKDSFKTWTHFGTKLNYKNTLRNFLVSKHVCKILIIINFVVIYF